MDNTDPIFKSLIQCVLYGTPGDAQILLSQGKNPAATDNNGWTPIHHAAHRGHLSMLRLLMKGPKDNKRHLNSLQSWIGETPLMVACKIGKINIEVLKFLIDSGADVNAKTPVLQTPLYFACQNPGNLEALKLLIASGADPNIVEEVDGFTALHNAIYESKDLEMIEYLAEHCDPGRSDINQRDAMSLACMRCASAVPILLRKMTPTTDNLNIAIFMKDWDVLTKIMLHCKEFTVTLDYPDVFLPIHFTVEDSRAFKMVLDVLPSAVLEAFEEGADDRKLLPAWIAEASDINVAHEEMKILLEFNHRTGRKIQRVPHLNEVSDIAGKVLRKYFIVEEDEAPTLPDLKDASRLAFRKAIRSQCRNEWEAYCWLRDSMLPPSIKRYLFYDDDQLH